MSRSCSHHRPPGPLSPCRSSFIEVVCTVGATPPQTATSPPANGGNCTNRGATRRRHAVARLLMLQNPPPLPEQSQVAAPMSARTRPRHPFTRSRGSHTQARDAVFTGTRQTRPTKRVTFPRQKAKKSPFQQHVLSILIVGSNQLQYRLSRTRKPKSRHKTNTFCPITLNPRLAPRACAQAQENPGT